MSKIVNLYNVWNLKSTVNTLYKQNNSYSYSLEHPEFRKLFDEHFSSWDKVKDIFVFKIIVNLKLCSLNLKYNVWNFRVFFIF
jgi:hypothetical protein